MVTRHMPGRGLGLGSRSTEGAGVLVAVWVGVWPDQQQAGQNTQQRYHKYLFFCFELLLAFLHACVG